jgi:uncharacterized protein YjbI with pentapeptide repeats
MSNNIPTIGDNQVIPNPDVNTQYQLGPDVTGTGVGPDLTQQDLTQPELTQPDLTGTDLTGPDLTGPDLTQPDLTQPDLTQPDLTQPDLTQPDLTQPDLTQPDLTQPDLTQPDLTQPGLTGVGNDLTGNNVTGVGTDLTGNNVTGVGTDLTGNNVTGVGTGTDSTQPVTNNVTEPTNITITIDKSTLVSLSQNLNANLLITISAYKNVLSKLTEIVTNPDKQQQINENIEMLNGIEKSVTELLGKVQENLEIPSDKLIEPSKLLEKGNNSFINTALQIDAATILSFLGTAVAMAGGKKTKGRRKTVHKKTKRHKNLKKE